MSTSQTEIVGSEHDIQIINLETHIQATEEFEDEWDDLDWEIYDSAPLLNSFDDDREPPQLLINIIAEMGRSLGFDVSTPEKARKLTRQVIAMESTPVAPLKNDDRTEQPVLRAIPLNTKAEREAKKRQRQDRNRNRH